MKREGMRGGACKRVGGGLEEDGLIKMEAQRLGEQGRESMYRKCSAINKVGKKKQTTHY